MDSSYTSKTTKPIYRGTQIVWYILSVIEVVIALRFILKLLAANPGAGFTDFIYDLSGFFVAPFLAVFQSARVEGSVFEWSSLLAMAVYWLIAWGIIKLFFMGKTISTPEAAAKLNKEE